MKYLDFINRSCEIYWKFDKEFESNYVNDVKEVSIFTSFISFFLVQVFVALVSSLIMAIFLREIMTNLSLFFLLVVSVSVVFALLNIVFTIIIFIFFKLFGGVGKFFETFHFIFALQIFGTLAGTVLNLFLPFGFLWNVMTQVRVLSNLNQVSYTKGILSYVFAMILVISLFIVLVGFYVKSLL